MTARIVNFLNNVERYLVVVFMTILVSCLSYSAFVRYFVTNSHLTKLSYVAEELSLFSFVWMLYLGASISARDGSHFRVTAQFNFLPKSLFPWRFLAADLIWLGFNLFVVWQGVLLVNSAIVRPEHSLAIHAPMWLIYAIIPLSFALTSVRIIQVYLSGDNAKDTSELAQLVGE